MKENLGKHQAVQKVNSSVKSSFNATYAGYNPLSDSEADLVSKVAVERRELAKQFSGINQVTQKLKAQALSNFDKAVKAQNHEHKAELLTKSRQIFNGWKKDKMNAFQIDSQLLKIKPEVNAEFYQSLKKIS